MLNMVFPDSPKREVGQKNAQAWSDEQVLVYYCYDRLVNYKYVGIIDLDEFILPHKDKNFEELFVSGGSGETTQLNYHVSLLKKSLLQKDGTEKFHLVVLLIGQSKHMSC